MLRPAKFNQIYTLQNDVLGTPLHPTNREVNSTANAGLGQSTIEKWQPKIFKAQYPNSGKVFLTWSRSGPQI